MDADHWADPTGQILEPISPLRDDAVRAGRAARLVGAGATSVVLTVVSGIGALVLLMRGGPRFAGWSPSPTEPSSLAYICACGHPLDVSQIT